MSIYDAIANPMIPNIAQATMQGRGLRMQEQQAAQQAQLFPLQLQAAQQAVDKGDLEIEQMRNPPRDYAREQQGLNLFRSRAAAVSDLMAPIAEMAPEEQWGYFQQNAATIASLLGEDVELPQSPQELPYFTRSMVLLSDAAGETQRKVREIQQMRLEGRDEEADLLEGSLEQGFRNNMVPNIGQQVQYPNGDTVLVQTDADLQAAITGKAIPVTPIQRVEQGGPGQFASASDEASFRNVEAATRGAVDTLDRMVTQLEEGGAEILGASGTLSRMLDSAAQQVRAIVPQLGGVATVNGRQVNESRLSNPEHYASDIVTLFGETAARSAAFRANITHAAYLLARIADPSGRLSDFDVRIQMQRMAADGGSPTQIAAAIRETRSATLNSFRNLAESRNQPVPAWAATEGPNLTDQPSQRGRRTNSESRNARWEQLRNTYLGNDDNGG